MSQEHFNVEKQMEVVQFIPSSLSLIKFQLNIDLSHTWWGKVSNEGNPLGVMILAKWTCPDSSRVIVLEL